jgi:hypothetical protein
MSPTYRVVISGVAAFRAATPYTEPIVVCRAKPSATERKQICQPKNIFQRVLLHIREWVESRVNTTRIKRALDPFINEAGGKVFGSLTEQHFEKLESALSSANRVKSGKGKVIDKAVRDNLNQFNLVQRRALQDQLAQRGQSGKPVDAALMQAVHNCVQEALIARIEAQLFVILEAFAMHAAKPFEELVAAKELEQPLEMILDLVRPDSGATVQTVQVDNLFKCLTTLGIKSIKAWFSHQRPVQQQRIGAAILHAAKNPDFLKPDAPKAHRSFQAFCAVISGFAVKPGETCLIWPC